MQSSERDRIKRKIISINSKRWWGDDFDVRFYLISILKQFKSKRILDIGGGIGIISSELDESNFCVNLDNSLEDLRECKKNFPSINLICASMYNLPFRNGPDVFDCIVLSNVLEVDKSMAFHLVNESKIMSKHILITTPNNTYYQTTKLNYEELKNVIQDGKIWFYNTYRKLTKNRKLNFANVIPKIKSKIINPDKIIQELKKKSSLGQYSVSFYVEIKI